MKIAPLNTTDPWFGRVTADATATKETLRNVPVETTVQMELVELLHGEAGSNYRPYLHLRGELTSVIPSVELPYGVDELLLRRGSGTTIDAFYDFDARQLGDLVAKGYFTEAFQVPEEMSGIPWVIPGSADFVVVGPEYADQPPVVFMQVHEHSALELDEDSLGDSLSKYFPDYQHEAEAQAVAGVEKSEELARDGSGVDIFADVQFEEYRPSVVAPVVTGEETELEAVPDGVFSRLVAEIEARQSAESELELDAAGVIAAEPVPGSAEDIYQNRVAPGVERVLLGIAEEQLSEAEQQAFEEGLAEQEQELVEPPASEAEAPSDEERAEAEAELETEQLVEPPESEDEDIVVPEGFLNLSDPEPELGPEPMTIGIATEKKTEDGRVRAQARLRAQQAAEREAAEQDEELSPGV